MTLIFAVFDDLYSFARDTLSKLFIPSGDTKTLPIMYMPAREERKALPQPSIANPDVSTAVPISEIISEQIAAAPQRNTIVYSLSDGAPLRTTPEIGIDNVLVRIPYGSMLVALESNDEWVRAFHRGVEGWISLHDLADRAAHVYPKLVVGEENRADDPNTERIRAIIADEFSLGEGSESLSAEEYVLYKLLRRGADVKWNNVRPRLAGSWAEIMKDAGGALISNEPKQRAVMEWILEDGKGHVAYVEAVFPDGSIQISEANMPDHGIYNERVLIKEEWQKLNPTFILIA